MAPHTDKHIKQAVVMVCGGNNAASFATLGLAKTAFECHVFDEHHVREQDIPHSIYNEADLNFAIPTVLDERLAGQRVLQHERPYPTLERDTPPELGLFVAVGSPLVVVSCLNHRTQRGELALWAARFANLLVDIRSNVNVAEIWTVPNSHITEYLRRNEHDDVQHDGGEIATNLWLASATMVAIARWLEGGYEGQYFHRRFDVADGSALEAEPMHLSPDLQRAVPLA